MQLSALSSTWPSCICRLLCIACFEQSQLEGKASRYAEPKGRGMLLFQPDYFSQIYRCVCVICFADHFPWTASNLVQRHVFVCGRAGVQEQSQRVMTYTRGLLQPASSSSCKPPQVSVPIISLALMQAVSGVQAVLVCLEELPTICLTTSQEIHHRVMDNLNWHNQHV